VSLDTRSVPVKWHLYTSNRLSRGYECDRQTTDKSDHAAEKCAVIGGNRRSPCAAKGIPPKKLYSSYLDNKRYLFIHKISISYRTEIV